MFLKKTGTDAGMMDGVTDTTGTYLHGKSNWWNKSMIKEVYSVTV